MRKTTNAELGRPTLVEFVNQKKLDVVVVADNIRSQNNIGSLFRTCDAFGLKELLLCGISATPPSKDIHKTALGAELSVAWRHFATTGEALMVLREAGYTLLSVEQVQDAVLLDQFQADPAVSYALIFGNEVDGVDQKVVDQCAGSLEIPQLGTKHSLNVAVSAGVVLWEFFRQLRGFR